MEQEAVDDRMLKAGTVPVTGEVDQLPAVSSGNLRQEEEDEEAELQKLQAEMAT